MRALAVGLTEGAVTVLDVSRNSLGDAGAAELAAAISVWNHGCFPGAWGVGWAWDRDECREGVGMSAGRV